MFIMLKIMLTEQKQLTSSYENEENSSIRHGGTAQTLKEADTLPERLSFVSSTNARYLATISSSGFTGYKKHTIKLEADINQKKATQQFCNEKISLIFRLPQQH